MVIWLEIHMWQHRDDDHREDEFHFILYSFRHWRNLLIPLTHIWTDVQIITMKGMYQEKESFQSLEKLSNVLILTAMERKYSYNVFDMSMLINNRAQLIYCIRKIYYFPYRTNYMMCIIKYLNILMIS